MNTICSIPSMWKCVEILQAEQLHLKLEVQNLQGGFVKGKDKCILD